VAGMCEAGASTDDQHRRGGVMRSALNPGLPAERGRLRAGQGGETQPD